jgi:hypothetical protein
MKRGLGGIDRDALLGLAVLDIPVDIDDAVDGFGG